MACRPRLAFENGAAHSAFGIDDCVDTPTIEVGSDPGIEDHIGQHKFEGFRVNGRVDRRFVTIDDSVLEHVQFLHQLFADAEDDLLLVSIVERKNSEDEAAGCEPSEISVPLDESDVDAQPLGTKRSRRACRTASDNQDARLCARPTVPFAVALPYHQRSSREPGLQVEELIVRRPDSLPPTKAASEIRPRTSLLQPSNDASNLFVSGFLTCFHSSDG